MDKKNTIREWQKEYEFGSFDKSDVDTQCEAGWWDWFCDDSELQDRLDSYIAPIIMGITNEYLLDNFYVWFTNNMPANSEETYDMIRFDPLDESERENKLVVISCRDPRDNYNYAIYDADAIFGKGTNKPAVFASRYLVYDYLNKLTF